MLCMHLYFQSRVFVKHMNGAAHRRRKGRKKGILRAQNEIVDEQEPKLEIVMLAQCS
jgi:hypothetical protein